MSQQAGGPHSSGSQQSPEESGQRSSGRFGRRSILSAAGGALALTVAAQSSAAAETDSPDGQDGKNQGSNRDGNERDEGRYSTSTGEKPLAADYAELRAAWKAMLVGTDIDPSDPRFAAAITALDEGAAASRALLDRRPDRDRVFTDLGFDTAEGMGGTYGRLARMASAWATPGSAIEGDPDVLAEILAGLRTTYDLVYNERQKEFGNWWEWEIGATRNLTDILTLVYDHVSAEDLALYLGAIDHFVPDPFYQFPPERGRELSTGANRVDLCRAIAVRGILGTNDAKIARARDGLSDVFPYVTIGDGFYRDGSFVQHGSVPYTGTYGLVLLDGMSKLIALLADSPWVVDDPRREVLFRAVEITFAPVIFDNQMLDFVRGRAVSRAQERDHHDGHAAVEYILKLAEAVEVENAERAHRWRAMCKGWLTRDTYDDPFAGARVPRVAAFATLLADSSVRSSPEPTGFTIFPCMDRVVHRRPGWAYAISMSSERISYYECGNGENNLGFHTGEGQTNLYLSGDNSQMSDEYWPTLDYYRIPGTTVDTEPLPEKAGGEWGNAKPKNATWVGGVSLDDEFGAVGMDLEGIVAPLRGRKSWFCLDRYVVALGAGITDSNQASVETVVENRNLHATGANALLLDGARQPTEQGWSVERRVEWAHLAGVAGYVFPGGARLHARREERTGSWRRNNQGGPTTPVTRRWLTMWFDHGVDPEDATYAYLVVPSATPEETERLAQSNDVKVLANTSVVQGVSVPRLGILGANFWAAGTLSYVQVSSPCSVMVRERRGRLTVAVSDPTHNQSSIDVTVNRAGYKHWEADDTITVASTHPRIRFTVDVEGAAGGTHTMTLTH